MSHRPPNELLEYLRHYDPEIGDLTLTVREFVLSEMSPPHEYILNVSYTVAMGFGPTARMGDTVCMIGAYSAHVNLGFNQGAELEDPQGLLQGTGKKIRHVKIKTAADLSHPGIRDLLREAWEHAGLGEPDRRDRTVTRVIKGGPKKKGSRPRQR
ncbi:MAG: hypothetical protein QOJ64_926 [Acidobacteriota bacterium]|jgi:hypothetical protein|nr:hypothetical protein [Acidobacteriota bacterium]